MSIASYFTVLRDADAEIEIKRSRFLARIRRVSSENAARQVIEAARKELWDARHHCSAFVIGPDGDLRRSNDDGEPSGTAGAPMLHALVGRDVTDVVAVVTRYFGGVLLGAGGLVRAYSDAVAAGLDEAGTLRRTKQHVVDIRLAHAVVGKVENTLRAKGLMIISTSYAEEATLTIGVPAGTRGDLDVILAGVGRYVVTGEVWVDETGHS